MEKSRSFVDSNHRAAALDLLRRSGVGNVERALLEGRLEGRSAQFARNWVKVKRMEAAARRGEDDHLIHAGPPVAKRRPGLSAYRHFLLVTVTLLVIVETLQVLSSAG